MPSMLDRIQTASRVFFKESSKELSAVVLEDILLKLSYWGRPKFFFFIKRVQGEEGFGFRLLNL